MKRDKKKEERDGREGTSRKHEFLVARRAFQ